MKAGGQAVKKEQGFSLIELLIGVALIGIIMAAVFGVLSASLRSQQYNFDEAGNTQDERIIIMSISNELRNAVQIISPATGSAPAISYMKSGDLNARTISLGTGTDANTVVFTDPGGAIVQRLGTGRTQLLTFTRDATANPRKITIDLTVRNSSNANSPSNRITTFVYTLN